MVDENQGEAREARLEESFDRIVSEGSQRVYRTWSNLFATGVVGGIDVMTGVMALLAVEVATGNTLLAGVAFSFGLVALLLGHGELFTEGFLVPVAVIAAGEAKPRDLARLWLGTLVANLLGAWVVSWLVVVALPDLGKQGAESGAYFIDLGINVRSFSLAVVAGLVITLMTRMQQGTDSVTGKIVAAVGAGFLLAGLRLDHSILDSVIIFTGLHHGHTGYGYLAYLGWLGWAIFGNVVGGVFLVTLIRLIRSRTMLREHREQAAE